MLVAPASVAARFDESLGQDVQAPAAHEFDRRQLDRNLTAGASGESPLPNPERCPLPDFAMIGLACEQRKTPVPSESTGACRCRCIDRPVFIAINSSFRHHWPEVRQQLTEGTYRPGPSRRKSIPKPDGGTRDLGIPNVIDRLTQQAILQVLTPIFDPGFSESSFGFRPKRSAHGAAKQIQQTIRGGYRWCVDMDLSKFFDRVHHDVLMARVTRKVHDPVLLKLIGRYLRAGVIVDGILQPSTEGTMQGGPLSPLLANVLLDDLDKVLEHRCLRFVRYADDFLIFVRSELSARRVFNSVECYLTRELKLVVNRDKSRVCRTDGVEFLGYQFYGYGGQIRVSPKSIKKFKQRSKEILTRNRGISMRKRFVELRLYLRGWIDYFVLEQRKSLTLTLDKWLRRRVRACYWSNWRLPRTR